MAMVAGFLAGDSSRKSTLALAAVACVLQVVLASVLVKLSSTTLTRTAVVGTAISATTLDFLVFAVLLITTALNLRSHSTPWSRSLLLFVDAASILLFLTSSVLSIYALGWTQAHIDSKQLNDRPSGLVVAGLAVVSINIMIQTAFHALHALRHREKKNNAGNEPVAERQSSPRSKKRSLSIHLKSLSPGSRADSVMASPGLSPYLDASPSARSSFRYSLNHVIRPITSKTKLLLAQCQTPSLRESQSFVSKRDNSLEISCRGDGFENWDTSDVENQFVNPFVSKPKAAKHLEPIPGSRPVSPAKALDGPFPIVLPEDRPLPESPLNSPVSPGSDSGSVCGIPFPPLRRDSNASEQAHIHPLFRTHSPTPPPTPSPGTVVTASPYAGQVVSPDYAMMPRRLHSAAGSRPGTPTGSRAGSFKSVRRPSGLSTNRPMEMEDDDVPEVPKR